MQAIKRHGGKHYLAKWIISLMPSRAQNPNDPSPSDPGWLHYVEPYFGGGAVLLANDPAGISEVVNDVDGALINFWQCLKSSSLFTCLESMLSVTPFSETEWRDTFAPDLAAPGTVESAVAFFVQCRQSRQGLGRSFATLSRNRTRRGMNEQVAGWLSAIDGLPEVHERLKRVVILRGDALDVIRQQDGARTLFYCDPPYLHETRTATAAYDHEMSNEQHSELLKVLATIQGRFLLSGYRSAMYDAAAIRYGWRCHEKTIDNKASSGDSKPVMTECVWTNY